MELIHSKKSIKSSLFNFPLAYLDCLSNPNKNMFAIQISKFRFTQSIRKHNVDFFV